MDTTANQIELNRVQTAKFLSVVKGTLAVWKSIKRYNLKCFEKNGEIFYRLADINKFLGVDENETDTEPLLDRKSASKYLSQFRPVSTRTLSHWELNKKHDLKPIRVGPRMVRYRRRELDRFGISQLKPH